VTASASRTEGVKRTPALVVVVSMMVIFGAALIVWALLGAVTVAACWVGEPDRPVGRWICINAFPFVSRHHSIAVVGLVASTIALFVVLGIQSRQNKRTAQPTN